MQIAISLQDNKGLDSSVSTIFGRCPFFMFIDPQSKVFTIEANAAKAATGGAGIQAAQRVVDKGVKSIITGNLGPKAHAVIQSANIAVYQCEGGSAAQAVEAFLAGDLGKLSEASTSTHSG